MRLILVPFLALLLVSLPQRGMSENIMVGDTTLSLPAPEGFALLTKDTQPLYDLAQRTVASENVQFAMFIPVDEITNAKHNQLYRLPRRASVQCAKTIVQNKLTNAEFDKLKAIMKSQNDSIIQRLNAELPKEIEKLNKDVFDTYHKQLGYSLSGVVPLPAHRDDERCLAYSMAMKGKMNNSASQAVTFESVATVSVIHVRGKVLFLWVYAEKEGLQWSREIARHWSNALLAANPSTGAIADFERGPWISRLIASLDQRLVVSLALVALLFLVGLLWRRRSRLRLSLRQ